MNEITVFNNEEFGEVRTVLINGEPWFVAADVCRVLEIGNPSDALKRVDDDEKMTLDSTEGHSGQRGGAQSMNIINEPGLYTLVLGSRKPEAKNFKRWITHDVIPSIRKTGSYSVANTNDNKTELEMEIMILESIAKTLNMNETSKLIMYEKLSEEKKLPALFIPKYGHNDNKVSFSLTELLKKNNCEMSTREFNKKLVELGYLEDKYRPSREKDENGDTVYRKFKALTDKGLEYGENVTSTYNTREVQPMYFEKTFMELYNKVINGQE